MKTDQGQLLESLKDIVMIDDGKRLAAENNLEGYGPSDSTVNPSCSLARGHRISISGK